MTWRLLVRVRDPIPASLRAAVLARDGYRCRYCGARGDLHADHVWPVSRGGATTMANMQALCARCNLSKGDRVTAWQRVGRLARVAAIQCVVCWPAAAVLAATWAACTTYAFGAPWP